MAAPLSLATERAAQSAPAPIDALLVVSFGGPEGMADVMPFLENVLRGRNVPRERMLEVAHHYELFGGVSPINDQCRALIAALSVELAKHGPTLPIYWGNRNWHPLLSETLQHMADDGRRHALAFITSAYSSYSACRQYREDVTRAQAAVGPTAPQVSFLRRHFNHPGFIQANVDRVRQAFATLPAGTQGAVQLVFTAHSIPTAMAAASRYEEQLRESSALVAAELGHAQWSLAYQSRSGPPQQPWLEPDIKDHLRALAEAGVRSVVVSPIGFVSDHLEVAYDLDIEAADLAKTLGLGFARAGTAGVHPTYIAMIRELILERTAGAAHRALGALGAFPDVCAIDCCPGGATRPSGAQRTALTPTAGATGAGG